MKDHVSVSQINQYLACPLKYKYSYIDELPKPFKPAGLALGSAVHSTVEWFHKKQYAGEAITRDELVNIFEADWWAMNTEEVLFKNGDSMQSLCDLGKLMLQVYYDKSNGRSIEAVEHPFEVPLVDHESGESLDLPLVGRIDLIETGPVIVDLKTSAYKPDPKDVNMNLQMTAYSYAYHHITGEFPKLRMDYLIKTKIPRLERVKTSRNSLAFRKLFLLTKEVLNGIRSRIFFPNPSWRCGDCEYRQVCWMFNGLSKQT